VSKDDKRGPQILKEALAALDYAALCAVEAIRNADGDERERTDRRWRAAYNLEQARLKVGAALEAFDPFGERQP
jgi:hypothetical protein